MQGAPILITGRALLGSVSPAQGDVLNGHTREAMCSLRVECRRVSVTRWSSQLEPDELR